MLCGLHDHQNIQLRKIWIWGSHFPLFSLSCFLFWELHGMTWCLPPRLLQPRRSEMRWDGGWCGRFPSVHSYILGFLVCLVVWSYVAYDAMPRGDVLRVHPSCACKRAAANLLADELRWTEPQAGAGSTTSLLNKLEVGSPFSDLLFTSIFHGGRWWAEDLVDGGRWRSDRARRRSTSTEDKFADVLCGRRRPLRGAVFGRRRNFFFLHAEMSMRRIFDLNVDQGV